MVLMVGGDTQPQEMQEDPEARGCAQQHLAGHVVLPGVVPHLRQEVGGLQGQQELRVDVQFLRAVVVHEAESRLYT